MWGIGQNYEKEQKQQYAKRQAEKFGRLERFSQDEENRKWYGVKAEQWKNVRFKTGEEDAKEYAESKRPLGNFRALPQEQVVNVLREESQEWIDTLTDDEKRAVSKYTYNSGDKKPDRFFERLNAMLRGDLPEEKKLRTYADTISKAIKKNKLRHDVICYRNMDFNPYDDYQLGEVFVADQFISTSVSKGAALDKEFKMIFFVPQGACGAYIENVSKYPNQREFLLDKGCKLRVLSKQKDSIVLEVIR